MRKVQDSSYSSIKQMVFQDEMGYVEDEFDDLKALFKVGVAMTRVCVSICSICTSDV